MSPPSADSAAAAGRIREWLLTSGVRLSSGPHRGGVAGWLDAGGRPEFVYLEIAGYYLTTLAWLDEDSAAVLDWVDRVTANGSLPPTRAYLGSAPDDWRNEAVFTFDLAMAARGVGLAGAEAPALAALLERLGEVSNGSDLLASHRVRDGGHELQDRWSTRQGPHHIKAAGAILALPGAAGGERLVEASRRTVAHWAEAMEHGWPCPELHPLLYGIEGLLMCGDRWLGSAEPVYARLLELPFADGSLPADVAGSGGVRSDVIAQALRAGMIIRAAGGLDGAEWERRLDALAGVLLDHVRADGAVLFDKGRGPANAWCAMFAHQALTLHADPAQAERARRLLV